MHRYTHINPVRTYGKITRTIVRWAENAKLHKHDNEYAPLAIWANRALRRDQKWSLISRAKLCDARIILTCRMR